MSKSIKQMASALGLSGLGKSGLGLSAVGLSVAVIGILGLANATPVRAQSSDNVNDTFDPSRNQPSIFGNNGLDINGLIDASRRLEQSQDEPWGLREGAVDEEVTRLRTAQDRRFGPEIFQEESGTAPADDQPSVPTEDESIGVEDDAVTTPSASESDEIDTESLDGEASEIAP